MDDKRSFYRDERFLGIVEGLLSRKEGHSSCKLAVECKVFYFYKMKFKGNIESIIPKLAILTALLLSMMLIPSSNNFQAMIRELSWSASIMKYLNYVLQFFVVLFSYYGYFYIHHHFLIRRVLQKKGVLFYLIGLGILILVVPPIHNTLLDILPVIDDLKIHMLALDKNVFALLNYSFPISVLILTFPVILIIEWYSQQNRLNLLEKEKTQVELNLLKQQINPHFFFNTLNNLYAMSLTEDSRTPETILKLSDLMRFVIYRGKGETVKLSEEIKYIQDYIDLQMIRLEKKIDLKFDVNVEEPSIEMAPLLFIIFVENAFKHGIEPAENDGYIYVAICQEGNVIEFSCENSVEKGGRRDEVGIGLENLKRRLELIYPNRHDVVINAREKSYTAKLRIEI